MEIRNFRAEDAQELSEVIARTMRTCNVKDYGEELIELCIAGKTPEKLIECSNWMHIYVLCDGERIVGTGSIGPYWGSTTESSLFTIFVLPEYQGRGLGRLIVETLEQDEFFLRAERIEIPASLTAVDFYKRMGYDYKNGSSEPDEDHNIKMEKFRSIL